MIYLVMQKQCQWKLVVSHIYQTTDVTQEVWETIEYLKKLYFPLESKFVNGPSSTLIAGEEVHTFVIDSDGDIKAYKGLEIFNLRSWRFAIAQCERRTAELKERWYSSKAYCREKKKREKKKRPNVSLTLSDRYLFGVINGDVVYTSGNVIQARVRWKGNEAIAEPVEPNYAAWLFDRKYLAQTIDLKAVGAIPLHHGPKQCANPRNLERIRSFN